MTDFTFTRYAVIGATMDAVVDLLETRLETIDEGKAIRMYDVYVEGHQWHGYVVYDT